MDIHNYEKRYRQAIKNLEKANISERNKKLILDCVGALVLENLSKPRLLKYVEILRSIAQRLNKDLDQATIEDIKAFIGSIQQRSDYSPWTKQTYKVIIRRFYKWLKGGKNYPEIVDWIKINFSRSEKKLPSEGDLLTQTEVDKLITAAQHPRDKALIATLWESGARIGEIGTLTMKNICFDKFGTVITVSGKTGSRKIRLIHSTSYLATWMNNHPFKDNREAPFWINIGTRNHFAPVNYPGIRKILIDLFKRAGVNKRCNPHLFRHSRATFMANHLTEFQMNQYFGWIQGSDMPSTYVHMSGREVDEAILTMNGIKSPEHKEEIILKPVICPRCDTINASESKHCNKCGGILDLKIAFEMEEKQKLREEPERMLNLLLKDPEIQEIFLRKMSKTVS